MPAERYGQEARNKLIEALSGRIAGSGFDSYFNSEVDFASTKDTLIVEGQHKNGRYYRFTLRLDHYGPDDDY